MTSSKIFLFDKDGTLVRPKSGAKFVQSPEDQELLPGVRSRLQQPGHFAVCSNQAGIAAGHKSLWAAAEEFMELMRLLPQIQFSLFCPDFEGRQVFSVERSGLYRELSFSVREIDIGDYSVGFRKPQPGMLLLGREILAVNHGILDSQIECCFVGDRPEDKGAAQAAGFEFQYAKDFFFGVDWD